MQEALESQYRADIDGLRAVAVLPVVLFHAGVSAVTGGFVGVDMFFVISGFVIALTLKRDLEADRFSVLAFYERRARRILPALTLVLLATYVAALLVAPPIYFGQFAASLSYAALFLSNLFFSRSLGYFFSDSLFQPLLHTWSLAIEEQYYLVAPILLFLVFRFLRRRWILALAPLTLVSLGLSVHLTSQPVTNFFSLYTRAWELLIGMMLALRPLTPLPSKGAREALAILGVVFIAVPVFSYSESTAFPGLAAVPPCLGTAILIYLGASTAPPAISKLLGTRPLVAIGLISYSLYLVHWPLIVFARFQLMRTLTAAEIALIVIATFVIAVLLYVLVERPLRRAPAPRIIVFAFALCAVLVTAELGRRGYGVNLRLHQAIVQSPYSVDSLEAVRRAWREGPCLLVGDADTRIWRQDACMLTNNPGGPILLWGDSFAAHYAPGLEHSSIQGTVIQYTAQGCPPILGFYRPIQAGCVGFNRNALQIIEQGNFKRVILTANWSEYHRKGVELIGGTLNALRRLGVETTLIGQSPAFFMDPALVAARRGSANAPDAFAPLAIDAAGLNATLGAQASAAGVRFVDPMPHMCPIDPCPIRIAGQNLYLDYGHFTFAGSARSVRAYFPYIGQ
jgi:peptidoglycan/LPS O-acetylase OafA/YrhL